MESLGFLTDFFGMSSRRLHEFFSWNGPDVSADELSRSATSEICDLFPDCNFWINEGIRPLDKAICSGTSESPIDRDVYHDGHVPYTSI